jgi:hypothetical protein
MSAEAPPKRNSGHTGPVTPAGRAISSQNSRKHGLCSQVLIQPGETMQEFLFLLKHWCRNYRCAEGHFLFEVVRQTAKTEWFRIRAQRQYNACLEGSPDPQSKDPRPPDCATKPPPNTPSSALFAFFTNNSRQTASYPNPCFLYPPLRYNGDTFAGLSPHRPPCQKPPT